MEKKIRVSLNDDDNMKLLLEEAKKRNITITNLIKEIVANYAQEELRKL